MKFVLLLIIIAACSFIGYVISGYFKKREKFFFDIHAFVCSLQVEINFFENKLKKIVQEKNNKYGKELSLILNRFEEFLQKSSKTLTDKELFSTIWILEKDEKTFILSFFESLGRFNSSSQIASLDNFKLHFYECHQSAKADNLRLGSLSIKLGVLFGILIALILI